MLIIAQGGERRIGGMKCLDIGHTDKIIHLTEVICMGVCAEYINEKTGMKVISSSLDLTPEEEKEKCQEIGRMFEVLAKKREGRA